MEETRVRFSEGRLVGVIRVRDDVTCPYCKMSKEIISFGVEIPNDVLDNSDVFYWCPCGHKWVEEPRELGPRMRVKNGVTERYCPECQRWWTKDHFCKAYDHCYTCDIDPGWANRGDL